MATIPTSYEEYQAGLAEHLNWFEKLTADATSLDERIDVTNKLLIELVKIGSIPTGQLTFQPLQDSLANILTALNHISAALGEVTVAENPEQIVTQKKFLSTANTAERLPSVYIPFDHQVIIMASPSNTNTIHIGNSAVDAEEPNSSYPLIAGQAVGYKIKNLRQLWASANDAGDSLFWTVEQ